MGRIIAIDFGLARLGIALSDTNKIVALPLGTVRAEKTPEQTALKIQAELNAYAKKNCPNLQIEKIVLGLPLLLSGKEGDMALAVKKFAPHLETLFACPVVYFDERLTSAQVDRSLKDLGRNRRQRAEVADSCAATTILQTYLDLCRM